MYSTSSYKSNQKYTWRKLILLITILIGFSQVSCQPKRASKRIIVAGAGKITSLDPAQANTFHTLQLLSALGEPLYGLTNNAQLQPRLAKSLPKISNKGLTIDIPLREDVLFHDGSKFDAEAMAFSLKRFMKIGTLNYIIGGRINSIETPEKYLLRLKLSRKSTSITGLLTSINLTPISPKSYANYKDRFLNNKFIGTGPYKLTSFQSQQQRIEPFSEYFNEKPKNLGIDFINMSNSTSLYVAFISGEIDVLLSSSIDEDQKLSLNKLNQKGLIGKGEGSPMEIGYMTLRSDDSPLNNNMLRKALMYSIDRDTISKRVSYGSRLPIRSLIPPSLGGNYNYPWPTYDPLIAKNLFKESGYCTNNKLTIPLTFRSNVPSDKLLAFIWKEQVDRDLSECLNINLNGVESTTVYRQLGEGAFEAVILDWRGSYPDPESYLTPLLSCSKIVNKNICKEGEATISGSFWADANLQNALIESDQIYGKNRIKKIKEVELFAKEGAAYIPIWIVKPQAWSQPYISKPKFDGSGQLLLKDLEKI